MSRKGNIAILTYHSLDNSGSVLSTPPSVFAEQMRILNEHDTRVVSLADLRRSLGASGANENIVAITFDDGFESIHEHALPVLQRCGFTATVFLVTDYCGKTNSWPGQPSHVVCRPLLHWSQVKEMSAAGITFGSHTRTHAHLRATAAHNVEEQLVTSKRMIEDAVGQPVDSLAYPYGVYDEGVMRLVARHFTLACSTALGFATRRSHPLALERLDVYYLRQPALFRRLFSVEMAVYIGLRRYLRGLRRRWSH